MRDAGVSLAPGAVSAAPVRPRRRLRHTSLSILGYGVSIACLVWVCRGLKWAELQRELRSIIVPWIVVAALADTAAHLFHGWRWNLLLRPIERLRLPSTVRALYTGLFTNEVLPLRPGELIRCYLVTAGSRIPLAVTVSSMGVERLLDGFTLVLAFSLTAAFLPLPAYLSRGAWLLTGVLVAAAISLLCLLWRSPGMLRSPRLAWFQGSIEDIRHMTNTRTLLLCGAASGVNLCLQCLPYFALSRSCRLELSIWAAAAVFILVRIVTVIPNAPGNLGLIQAACVVALSLFQIGKTRAAGFSAVLFLGVTVPILIGGAIALALTSTSLREVRRLTVEAGSESNVSS
jgi:uncharacterized membrane protein YbhN (UPF0104 family)